MPGIRDLRCRCLCHRVNDYSLIVAAVSEEQLLDCKSEVFSRWIIRWIHTSDGGRQCTFDITSRAHFGWRASICSFHSCKAGLNSSHNSPMISANVWQSISINAQQTAAVFIQQICCHIYIPQSDGGTLQMVKNPHRIQEHHVLKSSHWFITHRIRLDLQSLWAWNSGWH